MRDIGVRYQGGLDLMFIPRKDLPLRRSLKWVYWSMLKSALKLVKKPQRNT